MDLLDIFVLLFISLFSSIIANSDTESGSTVSRVFCVTPASGVYFKEVGNHSVCFMHRMALPFVVLWNQNSCLLKATHAMLHFPVDVVELLHVHISVVHSLVHLEIRWRWSRVLCHRTRLLRMSRLPTHATQSLLRCCLSLLHLRLVPYLRRLSPSVDGFGTIPRHVSLLPAAEAGDASPLGLSVVPVAAGFAGDAKERGVARVGRALVFPEEEAAALRVAAALEEGTAVVGSRLGGCEANGGDAAVAADVGVVAGGWGLRRA